MKVRCELIAYALNIGGRGLTWIVKQGIVPMDEVFRLWSSREENNDAQG